MTIGTSVGGLPRNRLHGRDELVIGRGFRSEVDPLAICAHVLSALLAIGSRLALLTELADKVVWILHRGFGDIVDVVIRGERGEAAWRDHKTSRQSGHWEEEA